MIALFFVVVVGVCAHLAAFNYPIRVCLFVRRHPLAEIAPASAGAPIPPGIMVTSVIKERGSFIGFVDTAGEVHLAGDKQGSRIGFFIFPLLVEVTAGGLILLFLIVVIWRMNRRQPRGFPVIKRKT